MRRLRPSSPPTVSQEFRASNQFVGAAADDRPAAEWPRLWVDVQFKDQVQLPALELEQPASTPISNAIWGHRSSRQYSGEPMSQVQLGTLLKGLSINRGGGPDGFSGSRRTYPSAGARYPVDVYLLLLNCEDAATGSYVFDPRAGTMRLVREGSLQEPTLAIFEEPWATRAAAIFVFVAQWVRTEAKYGNRGLAYAYLEAGHMAQNLVLISHELGLGCCPLGGFREPPLTRLLRLVSPEESPVYALAIGCPAP